MRLVVVVLLLTGIGCAKSGTPPLEAAQVKFEYEVRPAPSGTPVGRLYYFHGYFQNIETLKTDPTYSIIPDAFNAANYEVVYIGWPAINSVNVRDDAGLSYLNAFKNFMSDLNQSLPTVAQTVTGGTSFGGLHASIAASVVNADVTFAHLSVTLVSELAEFHGIDTSKLDITNQTLPSKFFISWGTSDYRVNWVETKLLFDGFAGAFEILGLDHRARATEMNDIIVWLQGQGVGI